MHTREVPLQSHPSPVSKRRTDTERLEAQLAEWTAVIAQYRARAKRTGGEPQIEFDRIADELQLLRNEAGAQVILLKGLMGLDWEGSVAELDRSWRNLRFTFQRAAARF